MPNIKFTSAHLLHKATKLADRVSGHSARKFENINQALKAAKGAGIKGISPKAHSSAERLARAARSSSTKARYKTGIATAAVGTTGFLGIHKYQQHQDNRILAKIDKMYKGE